MRTWQDIEYSFVLTSGFWVIFLDPGTLVPCILQCKMLSVTEDRYLLYVHYNSWLDFFKFENIEERMTFL